MWKKMSRKKSKNDQCITIVSGVPRSGTSMMMRMLAAGGMEIVVDNIRKADEDNPQGYYECEKVKKLKEDNTWLKDTYGKSIKVISMLLSDLPKDHTYKVIFMKRELKEIIASQNIMLQRREREDVSKLDENIIGKSFEKHVYAIERWIEKQDNMNIIYINYNDMINNARENVYIVTNFLGNDLNMKKMIEVVDKNLYRVRS